MNRAEKHGFTFAEVLVAIALFGLFAATLFPALSALDDLQQAGRQKGRKVEAVSLQEQLIARGFDPATFASPHSMATASALAPTISLERSLWHASSGRVSVWKIQGEAPVANRMLAYGFQMGAGSNPTARPPIVSPLPPVSMAAPSLTPASATVDLSSLSIAPATPSGAWRIQVLATGDAGSRVMLRFSGVRPDSSEGISSAKLQIDANEIAQGGTFEAWTEYLGAASDRSELLPDGRRRWTVTSSGTTQVYEPSDIVAQKYHISLDPPLLTIGTSTFASGSTIPVDAASRKLANVGPAQVHFSDEVQAKFGTSLGAGSFDVVLGGLHGPESGDVSGFFSEDVSSVWSDPATLQATPVTGSSGLVVALGVWRLSISPTKLQPPELATIYADDLSEAGPHTFVAPALDGVRVGRVSSGEMESTGSSLTVNVTP